MAELHQSTIHNWREIDPKAKFTSMTYQDASIDELQFFSIGDIVSVNGFFLQRKKDINIISSIPKKNEVRVIMLNGKLGWHKKIKEA